LEQQRRGHEQGNVLSSEQAGRDIDASSSFHASGRTPHKGKANGIDNGVNFDGFAGEGVNQADALSSLRLLVLGGEEVADNGVP